ncbi:site-specific integrase, partial [Microscilla marina]
MKTFQTYLSVDCGLSAGTSYHKQSAVAQFLTFYAARDPAGLGYADLLHYIDYLRSLQRNAVTINRHLTALGDYYDYLISLGLCRNNPAQGVPVKKGLEKSHYTLVNYSALEQLFADYAGSLQG